LILEPLRVQSRNKKELCYQRAWINLISKKFTPMNQIEILAKKTNRKAEKSKGKSKKIVEEIGRVGKKIN
jgi:hypothetical protein